MAENTTVDPSPALPPAVPPQPGPWAGQSYGPPLPAPPPRRRTGLVVAAIVGAIVVLGGLAAGALLLFGTRTLDEAKVEAEVVRITQQQAGVAPTGVQCPDDVAVKAGTTFTCTATLGGQPVTYSVRQDDDKGNVTISSGGFVVLSKVEDTLRQRVTDNTGLQTTAQCGRADQQVIVGGPGTRIDCTVTNAADPTDTLQVTGTVTDDKGTVTFDSA